MSLQSLHEEEVAALKRGDERGAFEASVKACTLYSLSRGSGGDDGPYYFDERANAAWWGYQAGKHHLEKLPPPITQNDRRWQWWRKHMRVTRLDPSDWTCWLGIECIPYRSQTTDPDELSDELIKRFPLP